MAVTITESGPPLDESQVAAFERKMGLLLPTAYRAWLLAHNGGVPEPARFRYKDEVGPYTDGTVADFGNLQHLEGDILQFKVWQKRLPADLILIGSDSFGNGICIATQGPNEGKVFFWDHEEEQDEPTYANCHLLADTFAEFLDGLH